MADKQTNRCESSCFEGRGRYFTDIERMLDDGLSSGYVRARHDTTNIEEARDLVKEEPPHEFK